MKKEIIIVSIIALVLIVTITCIIDYYSNRDKTKKEVNRVLNKDKIKKDCAPFTGGSFNLIFNTNGGEEIDSMSICIACSPDSYKDIPIPVKEGYKFMGWFTDKKFTNRITFTNTKEFKSVPKYDKDNCMIGYEDIEIYAKWDKIEEKENGPKNLQERF